jgi:hypothetical protein
LLSRLRRKNKAFIYEKCNCESGNDSSGHSLSSCRSRVRIDNSRRMYRQHTRASDRQPRYEVEK